MSDYEDLETRVKQFRALRLPGQPMSMHMGTAYLVNDLWKMVQAQHKALSFAKSCIKSGEPWTEECQEVLDQLTRPPITTERDTALLHNTAVLHRMARDAKMGGQRGEAAKGD